ncbi:MAG TPA: YciI family protein [Phycisphaerae bacterium]|nr:YciI family protein [Phycisphaerae bacterium]
MRVIVFVKASKDSEAGIMPSTELISEMGKFNEQLVQAGVMLAADGLHPSSKGVRIRCSGDHRTVIRGPFAETHELVAGYWIWKVKSLDEAIDWLKRAPFKEGEIEIRPIFDFEDFAAQSGLSPELVAQEERQRAQAEKNAAHP